MESTQDLSQKKHELKEYIEANMINTPMASVLHFPGRFLRRFRSANYPTILTRVILLGVIVTLPTLVAGMIFREFETLELHEWLGVFVVLDGFCLSIFMAHFNVNRLLRFIRIYVVDSMVSISDLNDLKQWLSLGWTPKILKSYLLCWTILLIPIAILNMYFVFGKNQSISLYIWIVSFLVLSGVSWSYAPLNMILSVRLSRYEYTLHDIDPARSEVINRISTNLNFYAYGYAVNAAVVQLIFAAVSRFYLFGVSAAFIAWIPLIIQFALNQMSMRRIIVNAKWKTLHGVQAQIKELHAGDIKDKNNIEIILKLMDYHDRIQATPNSLLDLRAVINLSNQLAIPSLGFILANFEKIILFFT